MKFSCPSCKVKLSIADEKVPNDGAWAKCPKCGDRFHVKARALDFDSPVSQGSSPLMRGRTIDEQKLIDRLRLKNGFGARPRSSGPDDDEENLVLIYPKQASPVWPYAMIVIIMVGGFLALLAGAFKGADYNPPAPVADNNRPVERPYDPDGLMADLKAMRSDFARQKNLNRHIDYYGREIRVFEHFLSTLAPEKCKEILSLQIRSPKTVEGFTASGVCARGRVEVPALSVRWVGESAHVTMADTPGSIVIDMAKAP